MSHSELSYLTFIRVYDSYFFFFYHAGSRFKAFLVSGLRLHMWLNVSTVAPTERVWVRLRIWLKPLARNHKITDHTLTMMIQTTGATLTCWAPSLLKLDLLVLSLPTLEVLIPHMAGMVRHHPVLPTVWLAPIYQSHNQGTPLLHYRTSKPVLTSSEELFSGQARQEEKLKWIILLPSLKSQTRQREKLRRVSEAQILWKRKRVYLIKRQFCWTMMLSGAGWSHRTMWHFYEHNLNV